MSFVIRLVGPAAEGTVYDPALYVLTYDPDGFGGLGKLELTRDIAGAKRYPSVEAAVDAYFAQSGVRPLRPDGEPNRPLRAYSVEVVPV